jgi:hypothetical protein
VTDFPCLTFPIFAPCIGFHHNKTLPEIQLGNDFSTFTIMFLSGQFKGKYLRGSARRLYPPGGDIAVTPSILADITLSK